MKIEIICKNCNKPHLVNYKQRNQQFCDRTCYFEYANKTKTIGKKRDDEVWETRKCKECGELFDERKKRVRSLCSDECRKKWGQREENKQIRLKRTEEAVKDKYGVNCTFELQFVKDKSNETKLKRYGTTNMMSVPHIKEKVILALKNQSNPDVLNKRKQTKLDRFGDENYNNREKFLQTLKIFTEEKKEQIIQKRKETNSQKNGYEFPIQKRENYLKTIQSQVDKFGDLFVKTDQYKHNVLIQKTESVKTRVNGCGLIFIEYVDNHHAVIKCPKCNNTFNHTQVFREYDLKCRVCNPITTNNSLNLFLEEILNNIGVDFVKNDRTLLNGQEVDYFIPEKNIAFELNGNYWHSELYGGKTKNYHINKTRRLNDLGIMLFHIFEDEIKNNSDLVTSRIKNILGVTENKIYARKCQIHEISNKEVSDFVSLHHLQPHVNSPIRLGLKYEGKLVSIMTFGKKRKSLGSHNSIGEYELVRFCSLQNTVVIGGFSKLLNYFIKTHQPKKIITFCDVRWSGLNHKSTVYFKNGFVLLNTSTPNYWYVSAGNFIKRIHRFVYRKDVLVKEGFDPKKTEWEIMQERGFDRIWDCGNLKFEMVL